MHYLLSISAAKTFPADLKKYVIHYMDRLFSSIILKRARNYYAESLISVNTITYGEIVGRAVGNSEYDIRLTRDDSRVYLSCNCPYQEPCKHLAAFLQLLADEPDEELMLFTDEASEDYFQSYLKTLSKSELVNLVQKFATPEFRTEIRLTDASPKQREAAFKRVLKKCDAAIYAGGEVHYERYEPEVNEALLQLEPFLNTHPAELLQFLKETLVGFEGLFENGELYDYHYNPIYSGEYLCTFAAKLILSRKPTERDSYFQELWEAGTSIESAVNFDRLPMELISMEDQLNYDGLRKIILEEDVMTQLADHEQVRLLEHFKSTMKKEEYLAFLRIYGKNSAYFAVLNAKFFLEESNDILAVGILEEFIAENPKSWNLGEVYHLRCEIALTYEEEKLGAKWLKRYLKADPKVKTLRFAIEQLPHRTSKFENILLKASPRVLATYLEEEDRPDEVVAIHEAYPERFDLTRTIFQFHQRYPQRYPKQAIIAAQKVLEENLGETGNNYYDNVVSALLMLQLLIPPEKLATLVQKIVAENKRKRNLIKGLREAGVWAG